MYRWEEPKVPAGVRSGCEGNQGFPQVPVLLFWRYFKLPPRLSTLLDALRSPQKFWVRFRFSSQVTRPVPQKRLRKETLFC